MGDRYEKARERVTVLYRSVPSSPHYAGGEFIDKDCEERFGVTPNEEDD